MFGKKSGMSENEKKAKMAALKDAHKMATDAMKGSLGDVKKVSVSADSKKGLKEGLNAAEDLLDSDKSGEHPEHEDHMQDEFKKFGHREDDFGGDDDSFSDEDSELLADDDMSEDELDRKIAELMDMKSKRRG